MDRVEFEMKIGRQQYLMAMIRNLFMSRFYRIYSAAITLVVLALLALLYRCEHPGCRYLMIALIAFLVISLAGPVAAILAAAVRMYEVYWQGSGSGFVDEGGFGGRSDAGEVYRKWEEFTAVRETGEYIFLRLRIGGSLVVFKSVLPPETVAAIRELLARSPIPKKRLLGSPMSSL
jgi:hypothetical protein